MFTGIIEAVGEIASWDQKRLLIDPKNLDLSNLRMGESIAVSGVCLTVVEHQNGLLAFDLSPETVQKTRFQFAKAGNLVNLERALAVGDRLGGHIVQGHVDETGEVISITPSENSIVYRLKISDLTRVVDKGSITVDGISLTVVNPGEDSLELWIIPHTAEKTNLTSLQVGEKVNIEYDVILKYVKNLLSQSLK